MLKKITFFIFSFYISFDRTKIKLTKPNKETIPFHRPITQSACILYILFLIMTKN